MERLGLGPDEALARNPALIYGRMTGFGQDGPLAEPRRPRPDLSRLFRRAARHRPERRQAGAAAQPRRRLWRRHDVPDCRRARRAVRALALRQGPGRSTRRWSTAHRCWPRPSSPSWRPASGRMRAASNLLDSGAPFYDTYETADGKHVAVACLEPQFFAEFARLLPLDEHFVGAAIRQDGWDDMRAAIAARMQAEDPRRMDRAVRADRRLRRAGAVAGGSHEPSAQPRPQSPCDGRRARAPCAGAALFAHAVARRRDRRRSTIHRLRRYWPRFGFTSRARPKPLPRPALIGR